MKIVFAIAAAAVVLYFAGSASAYSYGYYGYYPDGSAYYADGYGSYYDYSYRTYYYPSSYYYAYPSGYYYYPSSYYYSYRPTTHCSWQYAPTYSVAGGWWGTQVVQSGGAWKYVCRRY
ncbi:MAG: hypothetical protein AB1626_04215 [Candidatus Micrarchaeota archaeon]